MARGLRRLAFLTLPRLRALLADRTYRGVATASAVLYGLAAMVFGGMLVVTDGGGGRAAFLWIVPRGPGSLWLYPTVLAGGPHVLLDLPILSTIVMVLTASGVGLGMASAAFLTVRAIRSRPASDGTPRGLGTTLGLTPGLLALLTLGACCSTTAATSAGLVAMAHASGTTSTAVLVNGWYLGLFQAAVVFVVLVAQEGLMEVYSALADEPAGTTIPTRRVARADYARGLLRAVLVGAGLLWALSGLTLWFSIPLDATSPSQGFGVVVQHLLPGLLAVAIGLRPRAVAGPLADHANDPAGRCARATLVVVAGLVLVGLPAVWAGLGAPGLWNEIAGGLGLPSGLGAVPLSPSSPGALFLRWALGFGLTGGTALALGVAPTATVRALAGERSGLPLPGPSSPEPARSENPEPV